MEGKELVDHFELVILYFDEKKEVSLSEHQASSKKVSMDMLNSLMSLIDSNSDKISEVDYLAMCDAMKGLHISVRKVDRFELGSRDYYELEGELTLATLELERLVNKRDNIRYRTRLTKAMKSEAIREYAFTEGFHSLTEYSQKALADAGIHVNLNEVYAKYLCNFNHDIFQEKNALQLSIHEARDHRDRIVKDMANVI